MDLFSKAQLRTSNQDTSQTTKRLWFYNDSFLILVVFVCALFPRLYGLADFFTTDEAYHWIARTEHFYAGLISGNWAATLQTGHPGVSLMWLGSIGLVLEQAFGTSQTPATGSVPLLSHLAWLRSVPALFEALLLPLAYLLLRQLFRRPVALSASLLWACSPYMIAHSRLLHLDALLSSCVTLSVLFLLCRFANPRHTLLFLLCSSLFAAFALLTKGPALILLPFTGLLMFWERWRVATHQAASRNNSFVPAFLLRVIWQSLRSYALWLLLALLIVVLLWPALWVRPDYALGRYMSEISDNGGRPNGDGQFFLGQAIADPGLGFYPIVNLFRSTPATLIGWFLGLLAIVLKLARGRQASHLGERDYIFSRQHSLFALAALVFFWTLVMSLGPKKFDRYVLPTWPALLILAGAGWAWALQVIWESRQSLRRAAATGLAVLLLLSELVQLAWYHPYYLSYYNPLLGGGRSAQQLFLIGWGEGMDQVGAYLRGRPDLHYGPVFSALGATLQPFVPVDVRDVEDYGKLPGNYAVVYLESIQRAANPQLYQALQTTIALQTITIHGIEYARIYQLPRPFAQPSDVQFGAGLRMRGFTLEQTPQRLVLTPAWDVRAPPAAEYHVFLHLLDEHGERVAQIDIAPGGGNTPSTHEWQAGQQFAVPLPLDLPAGLAAGRYQLVMGVYDVQTNARLQLQGGVSADPVFAGENALLVSEVIVP